MAVVYRENECKNNQKPTANDNMMLTPTACTPVSQSNIT